MSKDETMELIGSTLCIALYLEDTDEEKSKKGLDLARELVAKYVQDFGVPTHILVVYDEDSFWDYLLSIAKGMVTQLKRENPGPKKFVN
jgi:hypothetical protein